MRLDWIAYATLCLAWVACSGSSVGAGGGGAGAGSCGTDGDCAEGERCASTGVGSPTCVPECVGGDTQTGYQCVAGRIVACEDVGPDIDCGQCRCQGARCLTGVGCVPKVGLGESCASSDDCESDNCSPLTGVCRVPVGAACDATSCDSCRVLGDWSACSRICEGDHDCGDGICLFGICHPRCQGASSESCPVGCSHSSAPPGGAYYCECAECTVESATREEGQGCGSPESCSSGECFAFGQNCEDPFECRPVPGVCASTCTSDGECPQTARCVAGHCLPTCTDRCVVGECVQAGAASVCDPRAPIGGVCTADAMCREGSCDLTTGTCR